MLTFVIDCRWLALVKKGKEDKVPKKGDDKDTTEKLQKKLLLATTRKEKATSTEDKLSAAKAFEDAKLEIKKVIFHVESIIKLNLYL